MRAWLGALIGVALLLAAIPAGAQSAGRPARIGLLRSDLPGTSVTGTENIAALKQGLADEGYVEGRNLVLEFATPRTKSDRYEDLARRLAQSNVDVIHAAGPQAVHAASAATTTIPIVAHDYESDPVAAGFITSYARPGRNVTGVFLDLPELSGKWLELLRQTTPRMRRVAVLWDPATGAGQRQAVDAAARTLGVTADVLEVRERGELEARFRQAGEARANAIVALSSPMLAGPALGRIAGLARRTRLPSIALFPDYAEAGGLLAYGPRGPGLYRDEGQMLAKILKGTRPADLPIMRPARFVLFVNAKTAKQLGVVVPAELLGRADRVIE